MARLYRRGVRGIPEKTREMTKVKYGRQTAALGCGQSMEEQIGKEV